MTSAPEGRESGPTGVWSIALLASLIRKHLL